MFQTKLLKNFDVEDENGKSVFQCGIEYECELPFKPPEGDYLSIGGCEQDVESVIYEIDKKRFVVWVGGALCEDTESLEESIDYHVQDGWIVNRRRTAS